MPVRRRRVSRSPITAGYTDPRTPSREMLHVIPLFSPSVALLLHLHHLLQPRPLLTADFSRRARKTRTKNTNRAYDPRQQEWRVSSPLLGDVRCGRKSRSGRPLVERSLSSRRASPHTSPRIGILRRQGLRGRRARVRKYGGLVPQRPGAGLRDPGLTVYEGTDDRGRRPGPADAQD
jgi:hypothetical protein